MAAELLLTFALEETLKRVSSIAAEGIGLAWGLEGQLRKLNQSLTSCERRSQKSSNIRGCEALAAEPTGCSLRC